LSSKILNDYLNSNFIILHDGDNKKYFLKNKPNKNYIKNIFYKIRKLKNEI